MNFLLPCILLFLVSRFAAGLDFQQVSKPLGQSLFSKPSHTVARAARLVRRSLPSWLTPSENHRIKRSTELGESCKALEGSDAKLAGNNHRVSYRMRSCYYSVFTRLTMAREKRKRRCTDRPDLLFTVLRWWACFSFSGNQRRPDSFFCVTYFWRYCSCCSEIHCKTSARHDFFILYVGMIHCFSNGSHWQCESAWMLTWPRGIHVTCCVLLIMCLCCS